ncbi:lipoprotein [Spiroplasma culicicola]|uniref:Lipoprotein n=1 Tax=Spiroplasma culicicola AES-1 TaxID=1276246 RepID=W6A7V4_9MOLU|nr:lipoprotein [Spiroplasma culicicola]AHI52965.1 hypothetical protein SCULI_v1c06240 [Spiroplasma culicicola AES-1]
MKKLLGLLGAMGLTATSAATVIACGDNGDKEEGLVLADGIDVKKVIETLEIEVTAEGKLAIDYKDTEAKPEIPGDEPGYEGFPGTAVGGEMDSYGFLFEETKDLKNTEETAYGFSAKGTAGSDKFTLFVIKLDLTDINEEENTGVAKASVLNKQEFTIPKAEEQKDELILDNKTLEIIQGLTGEINITSDQDLAGITIKETVEGITTEIEGKKILIFVDSTVKVQDYTFTISGENFKDTQFIVEVQEYIYQLTPEAGQELPTSSETAWEFIYDKLEPSNQNEEEIVLELADNKQFEDDFMIDGTKIALNSSWTDGEDGFLKVKTKLVDNKLTITFGAIGLTETKEMKIKYNNSNEITLFYTVVAA